MTTQPQLVISITGKDIITEQTIKTLRSELNSAECYVNTLNDLKLISDLLRKN